MRPRGRVSTARAARLLGVHYNTAYRYCRQALDGEPTQLTDVKQDPVNKYITVGLAEIQTLRGRRGGGSIL